MEPTLPDTQANTPLPSSPTVPQPPIAPLQPTTVHHPAAKKIHIPQVIVFSIVCLTVAFIGTRSVLPWIHDIPYAIGLTREHILHEGITYTPNLFLQRIDEQQEGFRKTMLYLDSRDYVRTLPTNLPYITPLTGIYINNNPFRAFPNNFTDMTQLRSLYILNGNLTALPETIGNLTNLEEIMLAGNHIKRIPESIGNLTKLTALNLAYNDIESLPSSIANMEHLEILDLTGNRLKEFPRVLPPNLVLLFIGGNHIPPTVLQKTVVPVLRDIIF